MGVAVVTRGNPTSPKVMKTIRRRGVRFTSFYEEEKRALEEVVHWLQTGVPQNSSEDKLQNNGFQDVRKSQRTITENAHYQV